MDTSNTDVGSQRTHAASGRPVTAFYVVTTTGAMVLARLPKEATHCRTVIQSIAVPLPGRR